MSPLEERVSRYLEGGYAAGDVEFAQEMATLAGLESQKKTAQITPADVQSELARRALSQGGGQQVLAELRRRGVV